MRLHAFAQGGFSGDAGEWKKQDNETIEILPNGERKIRFVPTSAKDIPKIMDALCWNYREACDDRRVPSLLIVATFVFDLLCIHPFRNRNGRVSRLATTLLLQSHGFQVARYVSLERLIEESKEDYYSVLAECSQGWHEGKNELLSWWNYFLSVLRRAYKEFEQQVESTEARQKRLGKADRSRTSGAVYAGRPCGPTAVGQYAVDQKILTELKKQGKIRLVGRGRGARWEIIP